MSLSEVPWKDLDRSRDRVVFQTREWIEFISKTQSAEPICAELLSEGRCVGYFTGLIFQRLGVRVLGSPFPGWTTPYMGFNMLSNVSRTAALDALKAFAFRDLRCVHVEVCDRSLRAEDGEGIRFQHDNYFTYETDLTRSENELFAGMSSACRRCIRKAEKDGIQIEQAVDEHFAVEYYTQLTEVFAKQRLVPTYTLERVQMLIHYVLPTGRLLMLRARDESGVCVATGIYPGMNKLAQFWGNASLTSHQHLRPNEALHWHAMRYWKNQGVEVFDWGGRGTYKEKYGVTLISIPRFSSSRSWVVKALRDGAQRMVKWRQLIAGKSRWG